jgi:hypothetical protein
MNNLVQLNNPNVLPIQNGYINPALTQGASQNDNYIYEASSSGNIQPRNSIIYRTYPMQPK